MIRILKDETLDQQLHYEGYVVIPLLSTEENKDLLNFYKSHHDFEIQEMYASAHSDNLEYRQAMSDGISAVIQPNLKHHLDQIQALGGSFIVKGSSQQATLPPHQDWNIVDEDKHRSFNLWLPLVDTSEKNGGLKVLPKSHLWHKTYRGPNISSAYEHITDELLAMHTTLEVPAGHAVLYDHRLLHASGPNSTDQLRIVAVIGIIEANSNMYIYYRKDHKVEAYKSSPTFFMTENPQLGPGNLELGKKITWDFPSYSLEDLGIDTDQDKNNSTKSFFNSLLSSLKNKFNS